jgi:hypothetical protein
MIGIENEEIKTKNIDNLFSNLRVENFLNTEKGKDIQVQEAFRTPNHQDQKRNIHRHSIIKILST